MTNAVGPRTVKLLEQTRRKWANGSSTQYCAVTVPNHIAEAVPKGTHFYPVLLADGSILFKRWDPAVFTRWIAEGANVPDDPEAFLEWLSTHVAKPQNPSEQTKGD